MWEKPIAGARASSLEPIERAALAGAWIAPLASTPAALLYLARCYGYVDLPWLALAPQLATFAAVTGALYAGGVAAGLVLCRRAPLAMPCLAAIGGAAGGVAPGAFAAWHFGSLDAPWFGGHGIVLAAALAAVAIGAAIVRVTSDDASWRRAALHALAPLPVYGPIAAVAIALGEEGLDWRAIDPMVDRVGAVPVGMAVGALVGLGLGVWIGSSNALATWRARRRAT